MSAISFVGWIANAAARFLGQRGAVTEQARELGCSRQTVYDHSAKVKTAVEAEHGGGPTRAELVKENKAHREENCKLWNWLDKTIEFPLAKQQEFAVTAVALGLSSSQVHVLLAIVEGAKAAPSRTTIHRWAKAAGIAAGELLKQLDQSCRPLVLLGCLDEIFVQRQPVLVGIEPHSMVWFLGKKADNHQGSTWFSELKPWTWLRDVISDAGVGLKAGVAQMQRYQRQLNQVVLAHGLDVFHTKREGRRALNVMWLPVVRNWELAEAASRAVEKQKQQGISVRGKTYPEQLAWEKASRAFELYEKKEAALKRAEQALEVFRPNGQLNDRAWAQKQVAWALPRLSSAWSKFRRLLQMKEAFTFLDRLHEQLAQLWLPETLLDELVHLWWLRRQRPSKSSETEVGGYGYIAPLVQQTLVEKMDPNWQDSYRRVAAVLSGTVRASSTVEGLNSVLRVHQSRHHTLTQGLLDVKRLYWNTRMFRGGKRKGHCPYEHLGLKLSTYNFWNVLEVELAKAIASEKAIAKAKTATAATRPPKCQVINV